MPDYGYTDKKNKTWKIRLSAAKAVLAGFTPPGTLDHDHHVEVSKKPNQFGIKPRYIRYRYPSDLNDVTTKPKYLSLPFPTEEAYQAALDNPNPITYKTLSYRKIKGIPEDTD